MRARPKAGRLVNRDDLPLGRVDVERGDENPLLNESAVMIQDDEEEVHDLGFIVDGHDDRRNSLTEHWERLESVDSDEALETDPDGPIPGAEETVREGVPASWYPVQFRAEHDAQERSEAEFAAENNLAPDPDAEQLTTVPEDDENAVADIDRDDEPESVNIAGRARGIARGFGTGVAQDIGPEGFSIRDNPLAVSAPEQEYPISTQAVSDEARGIRDVDEMGPEAELDRLADQGARLEEAATTPPPRRSRRKR